jgi:hypothetical protein
MNCVPSSSQLRTLRNVVCRQIEFWDCINRLESLVDMDADSQLWVERTSAIVTSGSDLTLAHVQDYLAAGLIHIVSKSWGFPNRELLLPELANAINLNIELWQSNGKIRVVLRKPLIVSSGWVSKCLPCNAH